MRHEPLYTVYIDDHRNIHNRAEAELKARFDREASAPDKELVWTWLTRSDKDIVGDVLKGELHWEDLMFEARLMAGYQRDMQEIPEPVGQLPQAHHARASLGEHVELTDTEAKHAAALSQYLAKRAVRLRGVRSFRRQKLGGTLEPEQVVAFLRTELRRLPVHEYHELEWYVEGDPPRLALGEKEEIKDLVGGWVNRTGASQEDWYRRAFLKAVDDDSELIPWEPEPPYSHGLMHLVSTDSGKTLRDIGRLLVSRYPWTLRDAVWLVLTGETPEVVSLEVRSGSPPHEMCSITFAPWVSEKTVRRAYHSVQEGDNRLLRHKSLAAFRFVDEHTEAGQIPKWTELTERWNEEHPAETFTDRSALRQAYKRAKKRLASPWLNEQRDTSE